MNQEIRETLFAVFFVGVMVGGVLAALIHQIDECFKKKDDTE